MGPRDGRLVYSTGADAPSERRCPRCDQAPCRCEPRESLPAARHVLRVRRERAGRRGKTVTVAGPLRLRREDAERLLAELKRECGAGGTLRLAHDPASGPFYELELQGDHVERLVGGLAGRGYPAKRAGG